jgi:hypothetical protein
LWRELWTRASDTAQQQALTAKASLQRISGKASVLLSQAMHQQQSKLQQQQRMSGTGVGDGASYAAGSAGSSVGGMAGMAGEAPGHGLHTE